MRSLGRHGQILSLLIYEQLEIVLVVDEDLHVVLDLHDLLLILIVTFLICLSFVFHFSHLGTVLSDCVLGLFDSVLLLADLILSIGQLQVRLAERLVLLVELLVEVTLILLILLGQILYFQVGLLELFLFGSVLLLEVRNLLIQR